MVVLKSESNEVIVKHGVSGKESLKRLFTEHHFQLIPEITSRSMDDIRCKSGGLTRLCVLLLGDERETTESLKHTLSSIKKDLQKERDESNEEGLNAMKVSLSAALENDEIVFARIDCVKQKKACQAYSFKRGSSNAELARSAQNVPSADTVDTSTSNALDANDIVMNLSEFSERTTALTKSVYVVLQFINSRDKGPVVEQIQGLQALAKKFKSERLLRFAYVDLDQNVSWKSFVNDVGENSVCVWHPSKLKYEKLGISCVEDGVCTKLDAVLDGSANWEKEIKDNAWFHSSSSVKNRDMKK